MHGYWKCVLVRDPMAIVLMCLMLGSCGGQSKTTDRATGEARSSDSQGAVAELAGTWSGSAYISGYGTAVATATLDDRGQGHYFASVGGSQRQGRFRIVSWHNGYLLVESERYQERIHATRRGDTLWVDNVLLGQVRLQRVATNTFQ